MLRMFWSLIVASVAFMVLDSTVIMNTCHALTNPPASSGSVTISAAIAPVRYILVDNQGKITEILSNSQENVTPIVYKNKLGSEPITLNQTIRSQYITLMTNINPDHNGVIYRRNDHANKKPAVIAELVRLSSVPL
jgi:hypothetical protein